MIASQTIWFVLFGLISTTFNAIRAFSLIKAVRVSDGTGTDPLPSPTAMCE
ncbi:Uncharacterised protein [Acinetobacter baumannii]|nr:Uncharacterised protein [Acinetobacter baumannii]